VLHILFSFNPSIGFLWSVVSNAYYYMREDKLDRVFNSIVREVEEEVEDDGDRPVSVAIIEDKAYWVVDNMFYQADLTIDGDIDKSSSRPIDAFQMSSKDITKMLFILDNLSEG
jgi:hypothetical protein